MAGYALVYVGVTFSEPIRMQLEPATFGKANENLFINPRDIVLIGISAVFEYHFLVLYCGPAEVFLIEWTDFDCLCSCIDDLVREALFLFVNVAFLKPEVAIRFAACFIALQAPLTIFPFILPAVSFLPVHFQLKVVVFVELSMDTAKILDGLDCDDGSVDSLSRSARAIFEPSHARIDGIQGSCPVSIQGASFILVRIFLSRSERTKESDCGNNHTAHPHARWKKLEIL